MIKPEILHSAALTDFSWQIIFDVDSSSTLNDVMTLIIFCNLMNSSLRPKSFRMFPFTIAWKRLSAHNLDFIAFWPLSSAHNALRIMSPEYQHNCTKKAKAKISLITFATIRQTKHKSVTWSCYCSDVELKKVFHHPNLESLITQSQTRTLNQKKAHKTRAKSQQQFTYSGKCFY